MSERRDDAGDLQAIVAIASATSGVDFSRYRNEIVARRVEHRMRLVAAADRAAYLRHLDGDPGERRLLCDALLIKTTEAFRGARTFRVLREQLLPELVQRRASEGAATLRAWSVGCSHGLEAASLAICMIEARDAGAARIDVSVLGTDIDTSALERAARGQLSAAEVAAVPPELVRHVEKGPQGPRWGPEVRECLAFARYDVLSDRIAPADSVFASFDLVACRNLLIYLDREAQQEVCRKLVRCRAPGGALVLDESEMPPDTNALRIQRFTPDASIWR